MPLLNNKPRAKMSGRIVGLNRNQAPPTLLSSFKTSLKLKTPKNFDDPPVSSEDEDDDDTGPDARSPKKVVPQSRSPSKGTQFTKGRNTKTFTSTYGCSDSSEEGDERAARAGIKSTSFAATEKPDTRRQTRIKRKESPVDRESMDELESKRQKTGETGRKTQGQTSKDGPPTSSGEHLMDERGFTKVKRSKVTYKQKRLGSSQEQPVKKGETKSAAKLRIPTSLPSPEKPKANKLRLPPDSPLSSPPSKLKLKLSKPIVSSQESTSSRRGRDTKRVNVMERSPSPPRAVFKMPASISELQLRPSSNDATDHRLTDDPSETEDQDDQAVKDDDAIAVEPEAVCPWCGEVVDKPFLDDFAKGRRLNVRLQSKFCQKHKKKSALEIWQQKKYPKVKWDGLSDRFASFNTLLLVVINGGASHFRSLHERKISSGEARSMKKEDNMNPGYYGPRGFNLMCDYLVNEFSDLLKKKAVDDRVIAGRGSAAFIQSVLVAELAVQLIMDDMKVAEEEARVILDESKALGEMIHEET